MRFKVKKLEKTPPVWKQWFAWYPVMTEISDGTTSYVWLEWVERKKYMGYGGPIYRYRDSVK